MNETNIEFVTRLMENPNPMMQMVIIQALITYAEHAVKNEAELLKSMERSMIHGPSWVKCCKELKSELDKKYPNGK